MTIINTLANTYICLSNDLIRDSFLLIRSVAELSPEAVKALEEKRGAWQGIRDGHFSNLLLMTKLVAWGVILEGPELGYEIINVIKRWRRRKTSEHAPALITVIGLVGWALVAVGVAGEFWVDGKVNSDDNNIQAINIDLLKDAGTSASNAKKAAGDARGDAGQAKIDAGNAKLLASGARTEADALTGEIKSANDKAADAVSRLADALQRQANAEGEIYRLKTPRSLVNAAEIINALKPLSGTSYTFSMVSQDSDSIALLRQIDKVLQLSGWVREKPSPSPVMGVEIPEFGKDFLIATGAGDGVQVAVDSQEPIEFFHSHPDIRWPSTARTAAKLKGLLSANIKPEGNVQDALVIEPGSSAVIRISVASKILASKNPIQ